MKKLFYFIAFIAFSLFSCSSENSYTFIGKFLNGTTNVPYQNMRIDFIKIIGTPGFTRSTD